MSARSLPELPECARTQFHSIVCGIDAFWSLFHRSLLLSGIHGGEDAKKLIAKASRKQKKSSTRKIAETADENIAGSAPTDETDIDMDD